MNDIREHLEEVINKNDLAWLKGDFDGPMESFDEQKLEVFLVNAIDVLRKGEMNLDDLYSFVKKQFYEYYERYREIERNLYIAFERTLTGKIFIELELQEIREFSLKKLESSEWLEVKFALNVFRYYKNWVDKIVISKICDLLFHTWDDIESDFAYSGGYDNGYDYHLDLIYRREELIRLIKSIDKDALIESLERVFKESHIGWGTSWDKLLAAEHLYYLKGDEWLETYFDWIFDDLSSYSESDLETKLDHEVAQKHLLNINSEKAVELLVKYFVKDKSIYPEEIHHYRNAIKEIIAKNDNTIRLFYDEVKIVAEPFPLEEFIK
ncbi:MAG: hypothetical protein ACTSR6_13490, partial [Candidatus Heimdallarchaeota archaeon]